MKLQSLHTGRHYQVLDLNPPAAMIYNDELKVTRTITLETLENHFQLVEDYAPEPKVLRPLADELFQESGGKPPKTQVVTKPKAVVHSTGIEPTTLKGICEELNITPSRARAKLRKANIQKPESGWKWSDPSEVEKIKSILI